jgi:hypothetical protein
VNRWAITIVSSITAFAAWAGSLALAAGIIDFGVEINRRLPFHSPVFAAFALAIVVALPMTLAALLCARRSPKWKATSIVAGAMLIGWIAVQLAIIQEFSWLQPVMAAAGVAVLTGALFSRADR